MHEIKIPSDAPTTDEIHGTPVATGRFVDPDGKTDADGTTHAKTVFEWKHPPGKTVPVPDEVKQVEVNQQ